MEKKDKLYLSVYDDYYAGMLTENQSKVIRQYYDDDKSLGEIAEELSITPQAVRDTLKRAEAILENCEAKLGLVKKTQVINQILEELEPIANEAQKQKIKMALELLNK